MKDWAIDSWEKFNHECVGKKVIIYGAGDRCRKSIPVMKAVYDIPFIVDGDSAKWGTCIEGIKIVSPNSILQMTEEYVVLILVQKAAMIVCELDKLGVTNYYSEYWMNHIELYDTRRKQHDFEEDKIKRVLDILADKKSKDILMEIVQKRKRGELDYSDIMVEGEYFREEFFKPSKEDIYVDGGTFDGDSIENFIKYNPNFKKIYAFEADKRNYKLFEESFIYQAYKDKIATYNLGIYDKKTKMNFRSDLGVSSYIGNDSCANNGLAEEIDCVSIDEMIKDKVTFIKMDIEGSEMKAIEGARNQIVNNKPNLAICIYHKIDDLWNIPLLIAEMVPEYKIYIRHHSQLYTDTVLYAYV